MDKDSNNPKIQNGQGESGSKGEGGNQQGGTSVPPTGGNQPGGGAQGGVNTPGGGAQGGANLQNHPNEKKIFKHYKNLMQ